MSNPFSSINPVINPLSRANISSSRAKYIGCPPRVSMTSTSSAPLTPIIFPAISSSSIAVSIIGVAVGVATGAGVGVGAAVGRTVWVTA